MAESRGLVKLFGKTIPVPKAEGDVAAAPAEEPGGGGGDEVRKALEDHSSTAAETQQEDQESPRSEEKSEPQTSSSTGSDSNYKGGPADQDSPPEKDPKPAEEPNNTKNPPERSVKKPDKILPCPRCNSMDTKFCYYNNYNVNQPRHFCKNCQRYWTAGGTMRNVPVGAGRRKNKHSASHYRHIAVAKAALQSVHPDITKLVHHAELKPNGTVLSFATDMPLCESMSSVLNLAEKTTHGYIRNGLHHPEEHAAPFPCTSGGVENAEEHSSGSSVTASDSAGDGGVANKIHEPAVHNCQGYPPSQVPCFSGTPWTYPWNAAPALCASSFPISFYPMTAYWGCSVPSAWSVSWLAPPSSSPPSGGSAGSAPNSPTLGKHSRDGGVLTHRRSESEDASEQTDGERCLWIPKTLRIDDPEEAAKSSIWATMGFNKNDKADGISRGLFKPFNQPKAGISNRAAETSKFLHANPAALSRSLKFQESS